mmetsp:Transcript_25566/g.35277  ORF Transcript_25566/g.35277 Transcript_25566/m.35277 type:complete len:745 (+) Transcript_25566:207-2441(+)
MSTLKPLLRCLPLPPSLPPAPPLRSDGCLCYSATCARLSPYIFPGPRRHAPLRLAPHLPSRVGLCHQGRERERVREHGQLAGARHAGDVSGSAKTEENGLEVDLSVLPVEVMERVVDWLEWDPDLGSRLQVSDMIKLAIEEGDSGALALAELTERFCTRLEFGTAGLRGRMGVGFNRMNDLTVVQATQGLWIYLAEELGEGSAAAKGVVIGFDARHNSEKFARLAAATLAAKGCRVYLAASYTPTPLVAYTVPAVSAAAGIVVTASHNPKEYNGYKVFTAQGTQIIPPMDAGIARAISTHLAPWATSPALLASSWVSPPPAQIEQEYLEQARAHLFFAPPPFSSLQRRTVLDSQTGIRTTHLPPGGSVAVYTPLHGVGLQLALRMFETFNLPHPILVESQAQPDPEFSTVIFPNPEEGADTWQLALDTADKAGLDLVLANDPDADRLAVACYVPQQMEGDLDAVGRSLCLPSSRPTPGLWRPLSGNELGALLAHWIWTNWREANPKVNPASVVMLASTVSSKLLRRMAEVEGFKFEETLTGFKWLGSRARELQSEGLTPLFAFEEAIGFMFPQVHFDKDGLTAAAVFTQLHSSLASSSTTPLQHLASLYSRYGAHCTRAHYLTTHVPGSFQKAFERLRQTPPVDFAGHQVLYVKDLGVGVDTARADGRVQLPWSRGDMHLCYTLEGGVELSLRASGTEPKLKYYLEVVGENFAELNATADDVEQAVVVFLSTLECSSIKKVPKI